MYKVKVWTKKGGKRYLFAEIPLIAIYELAKEIVLDCYVDLEEMGFSEKDIRVEITDPDAGTVTILTRDDVS